MPKRKRTRMFNIGPRMRRTSNAKPKFYLGHTKGKGFGRSKGKAIGGIGKPRWMK